MKESEILKDRLISAREAEEFVGKYYSRQWVRKSILRQTDEDIDEIDGQIKDEMKSGAIMDPSQQQDPNAPSMQGAPSQEAPPQEDGEENLNIGEIVPPKGQ